MKGLFIIAGLCLLAFHADARPQDTAPRQTAEAERSALARRYLELTRPDWLNGEFEVKHTLAYFMLPRTLEEANLLIKKAPPSSSAISRIVYSQLKVSLSLGAQRLGPRLADALVAVYAQRLTVEELQALIAYEQQPSRRQALADADRAGARMQAYFDALGAGWDEELRTGIIKPPEGAFPLDDLKALVPDQAQSTAPTSPIWDSIVAKQTPIYLATYAQLNRPWPEAAAVAEADYCSHVRCVATDREILTGLGRVFADPSNRV